MRRFAVLTVLWSLTFMVACAVPGRTAKPGGVATQRALVLGGGGATGHAWELGILKGLRDAGVDLTTANLIVGTSAGSIIGAEIRSGRAVDELYASQLSPPSDRKSVV